MNENGHSSNFISFFIILTVQLLGLGMCTKRHDATDAHLGSNHISDPIEWETINKNKKEREEFGTQYDGEL